MLGAVVLVAGESFPFIHGVLVEALTPGHLVIILIAVVLLAGYRKLPDAARSIGRSLRIFRGELRAPDDPPSTSAEQHSTAPPATSGATAEPAAALPPAAQPGLAEQLDREAAEAEALAARLRERVTLAQEAPPANAG